MHPHPWRFGAHRLPEKAITQKFSLRQGAHAVLDAALASVSASPRESVKLSASPLV
jgi:hypothetical protein